MWTALIAGATSLISKWFDNKARLSEAKINRDVKHLDSTTDYDTAAQQNMRHTLKDEYLILFHTFPIWGYAFPSLTEPLDKVWEKLNNAPDWWWVIYVGMVIATFGLRFMANRLLSIKKLAQ